MIALLITIGIIIVNYLLSKWSVYEWLYHSINYPFRKRKIDRMFKNMTPIHRRDYWLYSVIDEDDTKWYYRALERHIRKKYIEPLYE
jgi:hypothetical protein